PCVKDANCTQGTLPSCNVATHTCISCSDGVKNGDETGVDCGGSRCNPCSSANCLVNADCASAICKAHYFCALPPGAPCSDDASCESNRCAGNVCTACTAGTDCVTGMCVAQVCKAPNGAPCSTNADCANGN